MTTKIQCTVGFAEIILFYQLDEMIQWEQNEEANKMGVITR